MGKKIDINIEGGLYTLELSGRVLTLRAQGPGFKLLNHKLFQRLCM